MPPPAIPAAYQDSYHIPQAFMNKRPVPAGADTNTRPYVIFFSYLSTRLFLTIYVIVKLLKSYSVLSKSTTARPPPKSHVQLFVALAVGSLVTTWYHMIQFFRTSYRVWAMWKSYYQLSEDHIHWGLWLKDTSLFKELWEVAVLGNSRYFWTHQVFFFACALGLSLEQRGVARNIKHTWAFMLLGQIVSVSFATNLFLLAVLLSAPPPPRPSIGIYRRRWLGPWLVNLISVAATEISAYLLADQHYWHTPEFLSLVLTPHVALLALPFTRALLPRKHFTDANVQFANDVYKYLWCATVFGGSFVWLRTFLLAYNYSGLRGLKDALSEHPAVSGVGCDVIFCWLTWAAWWWTQRQGADNGVAFENGKQGEWAGSGTAISTGEDAGVRRR